MVKIKHQKMLKPEVDKPKKTPIYMKIISVLKPLYKWVGADPEMVYFIVSFKFLIDSRKDNKLEGLTGAVKKDSNAFFRSLWVYLMMGAFLLFSFGIPDIGIQYAFFFFFLFVMLVATLVSQFSTILLDLNDQTFLSSKPVSSRTLQAAKSTHVGIYILAFAFSLGLPFIVGSFFFHGIGYGLLTFVLLLLAASWSYIFTTILYALALVHLDGEKLKSIIAYTQIALVAFTVIAYQILGQLHNVNTFQDASFELNFSLLNLILFPIWFIGPIDMLSGVNSSNLVFTGLLTAGSILLFLGYFNYGDKIDQNLQNLNTDQKTHQKRSIFQNIFAKCFTNGRVEESLFHLNWYFIKEDREFKTRLYPSIVSSMIIPLVVGASLFFTQDKAGELLIESGSLSYLPYMILLVVPALVLMLQFSKDFRARWHYQVLPVAKLYLSYRATHKAVLFRLLTPLYFTIALGVTLIAWGRVDLFVILNGYLLLSLITYLTMTSLLDKLPFTQEYESDSVNKGCAFQAIAFIGIGLLGFIIAVINLLVPYGKFMLLVLLLGLNGLVFNKGFQKKKIKLQN